MSNAIRNTEQAPSACNPSHCVPRPAHLVAREGQHLQATAVILLVQCHQVFVLQCEVAANWWEAGGWMGVRTATSAAALRLHTCGVNPHCEATLTTSST